MTNYEFACCDLKKTQYLNNLRKKFKDLLYGDKVFCISIMQTKYQPLEITMYEYIFKNAMMEGNSDANHKLRKGIFYLTDSEPYIGFKADIHKSGSIISNYVKKRKNEIFIRVYATSVEECIERAEKIYGREIKTYQYKIIT